MTESLLTYVEERNKYNFTIAEGHLYKGQKAGLWIEYYSKKSLSEGLRIKARGFYKDGQKNGRWFEYHHNGYLKGIGYYVNGCKVGKWDYFDKKGFAVACIQYPTQAVVSKHSVLSNVLGKVRPRQHS